MSRFNSWNHWQTDAAGVGVCLLFTMIGYLLIVEPLMHSQQMRDAQEAELATRQRKLEKMISTINTLRHELAKFQRASVDRPIELVSMQQSNQRLADLAHLAAVHSLDVHEMGLDANESTHAPPLQGSPKSLTAAPPSGQHFGTVRIRISGTGSFERCAAFLHQLGPAYSDTGISGIELSDHPNDTAPPPQRGASAHFKFDLIWFTAPTSATLSSAAK